MGTLYAAGPLAAKTFTSEVADNIDFNVLMPDDGKRAKFAQIYTLDGTQEQLDAWQHHSGGLDPAILARLQRILRTINPYARGFKTCFDRIKEDEERQPIQPMSVRVQ